MTDPDCNSVFHYKIRSYKNTNTAEQKIVYHKQLKKEICKKYNGSNEEHFWEQLLNFLVVFLFLDILSSQSTS